MKILQSVPSFFPDGYGGGQVYVHQVAKELMRKGHEVAVLSSKPWDHNEGAFILDRYKYDGIWIITVRIHPGETRLVDAYEQLGPALVAGLQNAVEEVAPDIVHLNGFKPALTKVCRELQIPFVVTAHHPGFVCPAGTLLTDEQEICKKQASDKVCIRCCSRQKIRPVWLSSCLRVMLNKINFSLGRIIGSRKHAPYLARGLAYPWFIHKSIESKRIVFKHAPIIIAPSRATGMFLTLNGVPQERIRIVPHGIEPLGKLPIKSLDGRQIRFGYMGTFGPPKGFHVLIRALQIVSSHNACELHVYGEAQNPWDKAYLDATMDSYHGTSAVVLHGRIDHDKLREAYETIDVLIVPSIYLEVFGLVILEALSAGRPVIVSKSGGPEEIVRHGVDGFVVERNDSRSLAEAMEKFVDNPDLIIEMSRRILPVKTIQQYVDEIEKIYDHLISSKNEPNTI